MGKKKIIQKCLNEWTYRLGLRWWEITVTWYKKPKAIRRYFGCKKYEMVIARTFADWRYGTASIHVNLSAFDGMNDKKIESVVIHELCHVLVNELQSGGIDHEERVVTGLQKAFVWTRDLPAQDGE